MRCAMRMVALAASMVFLGGCGKVPLSSLREDTSQAGYEWTERSAEQVASEVSASDDASEQVGESEQVGASEAGTKASTPDEGGFDGIADAADEVPFDVDEDAEFLRALVDEAAIDYCPCHSEGVPGVFVIVSGNVANSDARVRLTGTITDGGVETTQDVERSLGDLVGAYGTVVTFDELSGIDGELAVTVVAVDEESSEKSASEIFDLISGSSNRPSTDASDANGL